MEWKMEKKNNGENSGPLTSLQVDRLTATDCNAAARANFPSHQAQITIINIDIIECCSEQ